MLSKYFSKISIITIIFHTSVLAQQGWFSQSAGYEYGHYAVYFINADTGWVTREIGTIMKTTDGGNNWTEKWINNYYHPTDLYFLNSQVGWMTADNMRIFKTIDGGESWSLQFENTLYIPKRNYCTLRSVSFVDEQVGYAVGGFTDSTYSDSAVLLKTTDGGANWSFQYAGDHDFYLWEVLFIDRDHGWICGERGHIFYTSNGGLEWNPQNSNTDQHLWSISFVDQNIGWIVGGGGIILKTENSGDGWIQQQSPTSCDLFSLCFFNKWIGYACGLEGTIIKTTESGADWILQTSGTNEGLMDICFVSPDTGWVVGWRHGTILKTLNGGVGTNSIEENNTVLPAEIVLFQNYPNPFNATTTITFNSHTSDAFDLELFDIGGRRPGVLYSGISKIGLNKIALDAKGLSSGIYFYVLHTGGKKISRKCLLVK